MCPKSRAAREARLRSSTRSGPVNAGSRQAMTNPGNALPRHTQSTGAAVHIRSQQWQVPRRVPGSTDAGAAVALWSGEVSARPPGLQHTPCRRTRGKVLKCPPESRLPVHGVFRSTAFSHQAASKPVTQYRYEGEATEKGARRELQEKNSLERWQAPCTGERKAFQFDVVPQRKSGGPCPVPLPCFLFHSPLPSRGFLVVFV